MSASHRDFSEMFSGLDSSILNNLVGKAAKHVLDVENYKNSRGNGERIPTSYN